MSPKEKVLTKTVKQLFNTIDVEDILREENGVWFVEDKPLNEGEKKLLIAEAQTFLKSRLWRVLKTDVKYQANKRMFEESKDNFDMVMGKSWLYVLDCIKTRLESLGKERGIFNSKSIK